MTQTPAFRRFHEDHAHVLAQLVDLERFLIPSAGRTLEPAAWSAVRALLSLLDHQFATHMRSEEEVLFPALMRALPGAAGTIEPLEAEHAELRQMLGELIVHLDAPAGPERDERIRIALRDFVDLLRIHIGKEESAVFAVAVRALTAAELESITARLEAASNGAPLQPRRNS